MEEIKVCPFPSCGSAQVEICGHRKNYYGYCRACITNGPLEQSEAEAIKAWNKAKR